VNVVNDIKAIKITVTILTVVFEEPRKVAEIGAPKKV